MNRGSGAMDEGQEVWDWEVLPDHMSSSMCHDTAKLADDQETKEPTVMLPPSDAEVRDEPVDECKDIGVVLDETVPSKEEAMAELTDPFASEAEQEEKKTFQSTEAMLSQGETFDEVQATGGEEVEEKTIQSPDTKKAHDEKKLDKEEATDGDAEEKTFQSPDNKKVQDEQVDEQKKEEDPIKKKGNGGARPDCVVFSVGKLKVNGIGALCSFGVAAATVCIFLIGGKLQHHHRQQQQQQKIQLQFYGDDKTIHQVVQQTSRLNQAMSSVMGGGASARANISFGGFYDGL